jgi:hypothetical protein
MHLFRVLAIAIIAGGAHPVTCFSPSSYSPSPLSLSLSFRPSRTAAINNQQYTAKLSILNAASPPLDQSLLFNTWEWCANLGAPAALVAGAVFATLVEGRDTMAPKKCDSPTTRTLKKACRFLLLTSFGLEVVSIFVSTVTGTMLLSMGDFPVATHQVETFITPIGFLMHNFEFEFLTARLCFLQGLLNWLASVALEVLIPKPGEGASAKHMNRFMSSSLFTIIIGMVSFLNSHLYFYVNYVNMWRRYMVVCFQKYFMPPTIMSFVLAPAILTTVVFGLKALMSSPEEDK